MQNVFLFLSVGLVAINLILMEFMQNTIEKEERIKIAVLTEQNRKIVLQLEAATSLYQMRGFQFTDELDLKNEKVMVLKK